MPNLPELPVFTEVLQPNAHTVVGTTLGTTHGLGQARQSNLVRFRKSCILRMPSPRTTKLNITLRRWRVIPAPTSWLKRRCASRKSTTLSRRGQKTRSRAYR